MYLNQFGNSLQARLEQILSTLQSVHGVSINIDLDSPNAEASLHECRNQYETAKNKIIKESAFNSYQQNPEYIKSVLILEAVKLMLTEIAPKRRRRKMNENASGNPVLNAVDNALASVGAEGTSYNRVAGALQQLSGILGSSYNENLPAVKLLRAAINDLDGIRTPTTGNEAYRGIYDKLAKAREMLVHTPLTEKVETKSFPDYLNDAIESTGAAGTDWDRVNSSLQKIREMMRSYVSPSDPAAKYIVDALEAFASVPRTSTGEESFSLIRNNLIKAQQELGSNAKGVTPLEEKEMSPVQEMLAKVGQAMVDYSENVMANPSAGNPVTDDELAKLNGYSATGEKLLHLGTPGAPKLNRDDVFRMADALPNLKLEPMLVDKLNAMISKLMPKAEMAEGVADAFRNFKDRAKKSASHYWNGSPEELDQERRDQDAYKRYYHDRTSAGEDLDEAPGQAQNVQQAVKLGQAMIDYASKPAPNATDDELRLLNAFSSVGNKLIHIDASATDANNITDIDKKVIRLAQMKLRAAGQLHESVGTVQEYEFQSSMARSELYRNTKYAMGLMQQIDPHGHVKPWIAASLDKAAKYLDKVYHYLEYKSTFEPDTIQNEMDGDAELDNTGGDVVRHNLTLIADYSIKLFEMIEPTDKLEGWVSMKLTTASECVSSCKHYMDFVQFEKHGLDNHFTEGRRLMRKTLAEKTLLEQDQEELAKAQTILAAKDMSSKLQGMAEDVAKMAVEDLMPLVDVMRSQFGPEAADGFNQTAKAALETLLNTTTESKEQFDTAVDTLSTGGVPQQASDIANAPAAPAANPGVPPGGEDMSSDLADLANGAGPGEEEPGMEEPLGRAKKDELAESAPPGKKAEDFIKKSKGEFKKRYGKDWEKTLYATAWKKFGHKSESFTSAASALNESKATLAKLTAKLDAHKAQYKKLVTEGRAIDPLHIGYGLEGEVLVDQINTVNKKISESKKTLRMEMQKGIMEMLSSVNSFAKSAKLASIKEKTPYGVIFTSQNGVKGKKMFENADTRAYWLELKEGTISNVKMIEPETFDKAMKKGKR